MEIKDLNDEQLWFLRQDIVLNSLFTNDYNNRYNIDPSDVQDFMDGYMEELWYLAIEDDYRGTDVLYVINKYDSKQALADYASSIEWNI